MKFIRIVQGFFIAFIGIYLIMLHNANHHGRGHVIFPLLFDMPAVWAVISFFALGWLFAWASSRGKLWVNGIERRRLKKRVNELEAELSHYRGGSDEPTTPSVPGQLGSAARKPEMGKAS